MVKKQHSEHPASHLPEEHHVLSNQHSEPKMLTVSRAYVFLVIIITLVVGFTLGTRSRQILSYVAPVLGFHVETGELDLSSVQTTYQKLKENFDGELDEQKLIEGASRGLVDAAGDKYTQYFSREEVEAFNNDLSGNIGGGIGAEIGLRNDQITILRVLEGDPAQKAGLRANDKILAVNDQSTLDWTVEEAVTQIRGEVGTTVKINVLRANDYEEFNVTRATIIAPSVTYKVDGRIGILTVSRFDTDTAATARNAAEKMIAEGIDAIILDLRGDSGGYLSAAQQLAGLWLEDQVIVTEKRDGIITDELRSGSNAILKDIPTVVLTNPGTASASEIVAGALHDYDKATLMGETTFGKGSVQQFIPVSGDAQIKITIAHWYTPNGVNIGQSGISPDIPVEFDSDVADKGGDNQLDAAKKHLRGE